MGSGTVAWLTGTVARLRSSSRRSGSTPAPGDPAKTTSVVGRADHQLPAFGQGHRPDAGGNLQQRVQRRPRLPAEVVLVAQVDDDGDRRPAQALLAAHHEIAGARCGLPVDPADLVTRPIAARDDVVAGAARGAAQARSGRHRRTAEHERVDGDRPRVHQDMVDQVDRVDPMRQPERIDGVQAQRADPVLAATLRDDLGSARC